MKNTQSTNAKPLDFEQVWKMFQETDKKFQVTQKVLDEKFRETKEQMKETDKKVKELAELFTGQWGKLVEALLGPNCIKIFQERGIKITETCSNVQSSRGGENTEIDVLLANDTETVVVEIKTTARISNINRLIKTLGRFKTFFPRYSECRVYGAVAALKYYEQSDQYASRKGLFVIKPKGEGLVEITNPPGFRPKAY
jgi:hypothetical protein